MKNPKLTIPLVIINLICSALAILEGFWIWQVGSIVSQKSAQIRLVLEIVGILVCVFAVLFAVNAIDIIARDFIKKDRNESKGIN